MKLLYTALCILLVHGFFAHTKHTEHEEKPSKKFFVRVLLEEKDAQAGVLWKLSGSGNFTISDLVDPLRRQTIKASHLTIGLRGDSVLTINGKRLGSGSIKIEPTHGCTTHGNLTYQGTFYVVKHENRMQLINRIELEDYVDSGVRWEMIPGWPAASLEAGAIAYRTYVVATLKSVRESNKKKGLRYDIRCTPVHQTYKGTHSCTSIHDAVKKTRGLIITYHKEPIMALYDSCCGGIIPIRRANVDFEKAPYLARPYPCTHCKPCTYYSWTASYTLKELTHCLSPALPAKGPITDVKITSKDKAGCALGLKIKIKNQWLDFPIAKLPHLAKHIKSCTISVSRRGRNVKFKGKGFGHQLGFCQWGSKALAQKGWDYKRILRFYYPGTKVMKAEGVV